MRVLGVLTATLILLTVVYPVWLVFAVYFLISYPFDFPHGIIEQSKLEQNFQEHHAELETIATTVRTNDLLTDVKYGYWGLTGSELQGTEYRQLYRAMWLAHIQRFEVVDEQPLMIRLVTDERSAMIDTNVYGYLYTADDSESDIYGSYHRLAAHWYLFEEIP